ncbi:MAG: hypothetical protein CM15mV8_0130 [Caudoviricetes sp.]|nr:MAG: hypothetical protein CM15mV8_0130 [Caudoviricetes sp.]
MHLKRQCTHRSFYFTGQVDLLNRINARIKSPVAEKYLSALDTPIFSILNTLFSTLFGKIRNVDDEHLKDQIQIYLLM